MAKVKQLNAVIKRKVGALDYLCSALGKANINIHGLLATGEVIRFLVDDPDKASQVLDGIGVHNAIEDVLAIEMDNRPGAIAEVTGKLARRGIKIRYTYAAAPSGSKKAIIVLSVVDITEAEAALK
jgi:hypothetical protein